MLKTKLTKPNPTTKLIFRKEVIDLLEAGKDKKLVLISAPAGYGKSTLISQWIDQNDLPYSWYSLDKSDNELNNFLRYTIAGVQSVYSNIGTYALKLIESNSNPSFETVATHIINDLYEIQERFYIIFDDYHSIENQQINQLLSYLLDHLPNNIQLVLITRSDPSIPLARLRSQQLITDIRLSDLCFNANNVYDFFNKSLNINLSIEDAKNLESKTEGWIAGLQLAALSMHGKEDISKFVKKLKGDNRHIMDYLIEEVLQQQDPELRDFLLCTSILNQFNASLCNTILNIHNGQELIERLEKNNMFVIPLDNERNWFRYHHLFASLLQHQLSVRLKDRIPELHASASSWFENNNQLVFALEHSLAAGNKTKALNHFANVIDHLWKTSQYITILRFGGMFTYDELVKNVNLCLNYFWILFQTGDIEQAEGLIYLLREHTTNKDDLAKVNICINSIKVLTGDIESSYSYSELALKNDTEDSGYWNILALLSMGEAHLMKFELTKSYQSFDQASTIASEAQLVYFEMLNRTRSSFVLWILGDYLGACEESKNLLDKLDAVATNSSFGIDFLSSILYCKVGNFLININQTDDGLKKCILGYNLSKKTTNSIFITSCTYLLAEAYYLVGEYEKGIEIIEELDAIPYKQATQTMCVLSDSLKSKLYILVNREDELIPLFEKHIETGKCHSFESIIYNISSARYQIEQGKILDAIDILQDITKDIKAEKGYGLLVEAELLQARAFSIIQNQDKAIDHLLQAILLTQSAGLTQIYINEGTDIEVLLKECKRIVSSKTGDQYEKVDLEYINKILRVFKNVKSRPAIQSDDSLSSRELDTLKLIAENLSNQEIADELYISITTVKTHVRNILLKLEAKNRIEAVVKAKEKGLLL